MPELAQSLARRSQRGGGHGLQLHVVCFLLLRLTVCGGGLRSVLVHSYADGAVLQLGIGVLHLLQCHGAHAAADCAVAVLSPRHRSEDAKPAQFTSRRRFLYIAAHAFCTQPLPEIVEGYSGVRTVKGASLE